MNRLRLLMITGICALMMLVANVAFAQKDSLSQAQQYLTDKNYDKALDIYKKAYDETPLDVYKDYFDALFAAEDYKEAIKLAEGQQKYQSNSPLSKIDIGKAYEAEGKNKKADEEYTIAVQLLNGDDMLTQQVANAFLDLGKDKYAIQTYERAKQITGNTYIYAFPLAKLYAKTGDLDNAVNSLFEGNPGQYLGEDNMKVTMLELLGDDPKKLQLAEKALFKKINADPENVYYAELLTWLYTQKNDWEGALQQIEAIDLRNKEDGKRLLNFAHDAINAKQYDIALKAYDDIMDKGKDQPLYTLAWSEKLNTDLRKIQSDSVYKAEDVDDLAKQYETFLNGNSNYYSTPTASDYALLEAQYANNVQKGIDILQTAINRPDAKRDFVGRCKLQLGDYYILAGRVWDASLTYSQVDKEFKEDALGEDARFRNAKLAYYRGDFKWAQSQLSVLKAFTSELTANDALYLSVLITENITPDSNYVPLRRFAYADLLLFQNKDKEAEALLDSISITFPKHPLNDDILLLRAKIAEKHKDYNKAIGYLQQIYEKYGKDVLGDDAVFKMAELYQDDLHNNDKAKHFYEQLIIDYPGSTFVQTARKRLQELEKTALP